jgi:hypothetical protein
MHQQISSGTLDSPSWNLVRTAKLAARIYAPLGTHMTLGDHVRVVKTFLEAFKDSEDHPERTENSLEKAKADSSERLRLRQDLKVSLPSTPISKFINRVPRYIKTNFHVGVSRMTVYVGL